MGVASGAAALLSGCSSGGADDEPETATTPTPTREPTPTPTATPSREARSLAELPPPSALDLEHYRFAVTDAAAAPAGRSTLGGQYEDIQSRVMDAGHGDALGVTWSNVETHTHLLAGSDPTEPTLSFALFFGDLDHAAIRSKSTSAGYEKQFTFTTAGMDIYERENATATVGVGNGFAAFVGGTDPPVDGMDAIRALFEARTEFRADTYASENSDFSALTEALGVGAVTTGRTNEELSADASAGPYSPAVEGQVAGGYGLDVADGAAESTTAVVFATEEAADPDAVATAVDGDATVSQSGRVVTAVSEE